MTAALATTVFDIVNTGAQVGTLVVVAGTAVAAIMQIRHLRATNELQALLTMTDQLRQPALQDAFRFVQLELGPSLDDPAYRRELRSLGYVDARRHPEMDVCNWFNNAGTLVKNKLIEEGTFLDLFSRLVTYYWSRLEPVVALLRCERGPGQYENFEYLAMLAQAWQVKHPHGAYPAHARRLEIADRWAEVDRAAPRGNGEGVQPG